MIKTDPTKASMIYFDSDMSKSTNMVVYFDWKTVIKFPNKVWRLIVFAPFLIIIILSWQILVLISANPC
jgi:hypothetical protein